MLNLRWFMGNRVCRDAVGTEGVELPNSDSLRETPEFEHKPLAVTAEASGLSWPQLCCSGTRARLQQDRCLFTLMVSSSSLTPHFASFSKYPSLTGHTALSLPLKEILSLKIRSTCGLGVGLRGEPGSEGSRAQGEQSACPACMRL